MNINTPKWIPKHSSDIAKMFQKSKDLIHEFRLLTKKFTAEINLDLLDIYEFKFFVEESRKCFIVSKDLHVNLKSQVTSAASKKLQRSPYKILLQRKARIMAENLFRSTFQLIFVLNKTVKYLLDFGSISEVNLESAFILGALCNEAIVTIQKSQKSYAGAKVVSNSFPPFMLQPRKLDIAIILQLVSKNRSEVCCTYLISSLLATCKLELAPRDTDSETSSIEILRTLTTHLTSPNQKNIGYQRARTSHFNEIISISIPYSNENDDPTIKFFDDMANGLCDKMSVDEKAVIRDEILEHLIQDEENYVASIVLKCFKIFPSAFETSADTKDFQKWILRGVRNLWTQIGSTLDHVVLWWSDAPLACRPVVCAKHLRDWLLLLHSDDAPEPILSTLKGLGETLTIHVTNAIWDQQFRKALVDSSLPSSNIFENIKPTILLEIPGTTTGSLWVDVVGTLVNLCNSCDCGTTIPNQLPIAEQIPIVHRLDHSIHTMRLWAISRAKFLCSEWKMSIFFKVVVNDIRNYLEQLRDLKVPDLVPTDVLEVLIQVCVSLRSKLVSEVKINVNKLKSTCTEECVLILASTCRTFSLATLTLCFPVAKFWQTDIAQESCNQYVGYFLSQVYLPILEATGDIDILSLILKIACESWLDHIYLNKVKFSRCGAVNLLKDFAGVSEWVENCAAVPKEHTEKLSKHEVLRMCEGVGRILLRKPEEIVSMVPSTKIRRKVDEENPDTDQGRLPPEMFVPNQTKWLELRARSYRDPLSLLCSICSGNSVLY